MKYLFLTILSLFIFIPSIAHGATEFISTIQQTGGDYSTLSSWEAAVQSDLTATTTRVFSGTGTGQLSNGDTVTCVSGGAHNGITARVVATTTTQILLDNATSSEDVILSDGDTWENGVNVWTVSGTGSELGDTAIAIAKIDGAWTEADQTAVDITGWETDSTHYIKIYTTAAARHDGKWDDTKYRLETNNNVALFGRQGNVRVEGLQVKTTSGGSGIYISLISEACDWRVSHCIIKGVSVNEWDSGLVVYNNSGTGVLRAWNNIIYGWDRGLTNNAAFWLEDTGSTCYINNNTVHDSYWGFFRTGGGSLIVKNNITQDCNDGYSGTFDSASDYNISDIAGDQPASGSHDKTGVNVNFADEANDDFHLAGSDTAAKDAGVDLSEDSNLAFDDDIDGEKRPAGQTWDIGADEKKRATVINAPLTNKLTDGLVGHWTFNGQDMDWASTTAEALDRSGNSNNGNVTNFDQTSVARGISGQALEFDGSDDEIQISDDDNLHLYGGDFTISLWFKADSWTHTGLIGKSNDDSTATMDWMFIKNGENFDFAIGEWYADYPLQIHESLLPADAWTHLVITKSGNDYELFLNSVSKDTGSSAQAWTESDDIVIGNYAVGATDGFFDGTIDEVRIYNRALSADEIGELYRAGARRLKTNVTQVNKMTDDLVGHWTFNGQDMDWASTTAEALDRSGNSNNGNVTNFDHTSVARGISGQALEFDGVDDYVEIAADASLSPGDGSWSVSAWAKPPNENQFSGLVFNSEDSVPHYTQWGILFANDAWDDVGKRMWGFTQESDDSNIWRASCSDNDVIDGNWHLFTMVADEIVGDVVLYVDGSEIAYTTDNSGAWPDIDTSAYRTIIGAEESDVVFFNGTIDEVRVYNRALSAEEVMDLYQAGAGRMKLK